MDQRRRVATIPGLARLLADLPRPQIATLAAWWDGGPADRPGVTATLYRHMTDRARQAAVVRTLDQPTRLILDRLVAAPDGLSSVDLAGRVPFADEAIERCLEALAERGIAWRFGRRQSGSGEAADRWVVPRDLGPGLRQAPPSGRPLREAGRPVDATRPASSTGLVSTSVDSALVRLGGGARDQLGALLTNDASPAGSDLAQSKSRNFAQAAGLALGVLSRRGRVVGLGPRATTWASLALADRTRALARVWLVDDALAGTVPSPLRAALAGVLAEAEVDDWYSVDSVARVVATRSSSVDLVAPARVISPAEPTIERSLVDRAIEMLGWIGVVDLALDARERPEAIRVTSDGQLALR